MTKILLVEDDKSLREIYGVRLLAEGYDIVSAGDGEEALAMAIKDRPSLIVSDVMMPKISGFDMLDILRSTTETRGIKVIMMTALSSDDQRRRGEQLGADRYLVKSQVGIEDVVRTVHEVLEDAPTTSPAPSSFTSTPRPVTFIPPERPAPTPVSQPQTTAAPAPVSPAPAAPQAAAPAPQPVAAPSPAPQPSAPAASSGLPQPTAPFSTPRPASLASRVIEPITPPPSNTPPVADLIDNELNGAPSFTAPQVPVPPAPIAQPSAPAPQPVAAPSPAPQPSAPAPFANPASSSVFDYEPTPVGTNPTQPPQQNS